MHRKISFGRRKGYSDVYEQMVEAYSLVSLQTRALLVVLRIHKYVQVMVKLGKEIQGPRSYQHTENHNTTRNSDNYSHVMYLKPTLHAYIIYTQEIYNP